MLSAHNDSSQAYRPQLRRQRRPYARTHMAFIITLALIATLLPPATLGAEPVAESQLEDAAGAGLYVSSSETLQDATLLEEQYIVSGRIFIFLPDRDDVTQVRYYLNHPDDLLEDPSVAGKPLHIATSAPFEFAAGQERGFDTTTLANGLHTITAAIDLSDGTTEVLNTAFAVSNGGPSLIFRPGKLTFKVHEGETATKEVDILTSDGATVYSTVAADVDWVMIDSESARYAPDTATITIDAGALAPGTYTATLTATSAGHQSASLPINLTVARGPGEAASIEAAGDDDRALAACAPLDCSEILIDLPYELDFTQDHGKIVDGNGVGTGFTYIEQPSSGTGYVPAKLNVNTAAPGTLSIDTTNGIMSMEANSQDNALGVGIDAPSQVSVLSTTLINLPNPTGKYEQAGLWFGNDEDNYVKLEVVSTSSGKYKVELLMEVNGEHPYSKVTSSLTATNPTITLRLRVNPGDKTISGAYQINNGPFNQIGSTVAPAEFFSFDAAGIDPTIGTRSFGGIFATHRKANTPLTFTFDNFSVTGEAVPPPSTSVTFSRTSFTVPFPTSMVWGPDNRLYVTELFGTIHAITLDANQQVISDEVITTLGSRLTLGITIDPLSTPDNVVLWVGHSSPSVDNGQVNSSIVSRLSGPGFTTKEDIITGLPRAKANHAINSLHFGPDGRLYIAMGGNTGAGAANTANSEFGSRAEQPLSAALLVADVRAPGFDGSCATPELSYGPPPCDVQVYSSGLRNTYDFVWHSNGFLYAPDNGLGVTGTFPPSPTPPCEGFGNPASWTSGGHNPGEQPDVLNRLEPGKYYGHPNPYRNECVFKDGSYQGVPAPSNYVPPIYNLGEHRSSNAIIEYQSNAFSGSLQGELLITNYSVGDDITRVRLSPDGFTVVDAKQLVGGFDDPLPLVEGPGGVLYVGEFGGNKVTALTPDVPDTGPLGGWETKASGPAQLLDVAGTALDGKLYVVAGKTSSNPQRTMYIYDPAADSWSQGPSLPNEYPAVENPAAVAYDGKLYVFGGSSSPFSGATTAAAVFDPATSTWTMLPPMATARGGPMAQAVDSKIYVAGGLGGNGASLTSVEVFDPATNTWSSAPPMQTPRDNAGSAVLNGKFYVFGGRTRDSSGSEIDGTLSSVEMFDPDTQTWTFRASMPTGRRVPVVGLLNGRAQVIGGERTPSGGTFVANEEYDPLTDTWRSLAPMTVGRHGAAAGTIGGAVYVAFGGVTGGSSFSDINEAFSFSSSGDFTPPAAPENLTASLAADEVTINLDWDDNDEPDLRSYRIYRGSQSGGPYTRIAEIGAATSSYADVTAPAGATSYYYVTAVDTSNNESPPSNEASAVKPEDTTPPATPANLTATGVIGGINLDWDDVGDVDLAGYRIYRSEQSGGPFSQIAEIGTTSSYSDATAIIETPYYYQVTAFDTADNESAPSNEAGATRPDVTFDIVYSTNSKRTNPAPLDGATVSGNIFVFTTPDTPQITQVRFYFDDPDLTGNPFSVENSAPYDMAGGTTSTASAFNTVTRTNGAHTVSVEIAFNDGSVRTLHANFTIDNEPPPVEAKPLPGTIQAEDYDVGGPGIGFFDTTPGNSGHAYRNEAVDIQPTTDVGGGYNVGWIRTGEWLRYTVDIAAEDLYTITFRVATQFDNRQLHVELDGVNISGAVVLPNTGGTQNWTDVAITVPLPAGVHQMKIFMDSDNFNLNYFTVVPADDGSPPPVDLTPPSAPANLTATGTPAGIDLDWADNTETDLAGYRVYRSTQAGGTFTQIAELGATSDYSDTSATPGVQYFYRVTAFDTSLIESAPSNEASGTRVADTTPAAIPFEGTIQAEDYDSGGQGVGYFDTSSGNTGGAYRNDGVDIQPTTDVGGGYNVGWIRAGEWLRYTVDIAAEGEYTITLRVATPNDNRSLHLELDGVDISGPIALPNTGDFQNWVDVPVSVELPAGIHQLKIVMDTDSFNLNYFTVTAPGNPG